MIIEALTIGAIGAFAKTCYSANEASKIDERALKKFAKAFEKTEEAELLIRKKTELTDKRLSNVAKKKRAIIENTVPKFVDVYGQIQKIDLEHKTLVNEITLHNNVRNLAVLDSLTMCVKKELTDKELVCGFMTKGLGKLMEIDSERYLSAASKQLKQANVISSQAESISEVYDAIVARADRISILLVKMNALFIKSIEQTNNVINKNGLDVHKYSEFDKGVLMTCVNVAVAVSDIINVPVVDENGSVCESALEMIETGEKYLAKMQELI